MVETIQCMGETDNKGGDVSEAFGMPVSARSHTGAHLVRGGESSLRTCRTEGRQVPNMGSKATTYMTSTHRVHCDAVRQGMVERGRDRDVGGGEKGWVRGRKLRTIEFRVEIFFK